MSKQQSDFLASAAEELKVMIDLANEQLKKEVSCNSLDPPDYYDYQTCYELMCLSRDLS